MNAATATPQPFLRWAGSKRQLVGHLATYWNQGQFERYVEPFAGSACLFFHLKPERAILGDINHELIDTYRQVKTNVDEVIEALATFVNTKENYHAVRDLHPNSLVPAYRAARFIFLNRYCFNGLYRTNRAGKFNVPYGGRKTGSLPTGSVLRACSELLQAAELVGDDFEEVLERVDTGDFVYMDPPFRVQGVRVFREYDPSVFSHQDLSRLRAWVDKIDEFGGAFVVSYAESEESDILSVGFNRHVVSVRRNIAGFAGNRRVAREVLISNITTHS